MIPGRRLTRLISVLLLLAACDSSQELEYQRATTADSSGKLRIVTLAPHLAEMLFDIGAGDLLVGVSAYTDYPQAVLSLPKIGDAFMVDQERLTVLRPDLILAWQSGTPRHLADELRGRGYRVESIRTRGLRDVGAALVTVGELTGRAAAAREVAARFNASLDALADKYRDAEPIRVFYQVDKRPVYTINGDHYVSQLIETCGGVNIFADIGDLAPLVAVEAVLQHNPEMLLASEDAKPDAFSEWLRWPDMAANRYGNRFYMPAGEIGRATTRLALAGKTLCDTMEKGRLNRRQWSDGQ